MANTELINGVYHTSYRDIGGGGGGTPNAVQYVPQTLTDAQKAQARQNIGGASAADLNQTNTALGNLSSVVGDMQPKVQALTYPAYLVAWDGASTPVVANIPAGVSVTYNTTTYTGTLVASASTLDKIYLVSTGTTDNYYRYVTGQSGSTYSWAGIGSTEMSLSDYATKAELSALDLEVGEKNIVERQVNLPTTAWKDNIYIHYSNGNEYSSSQGLSGLRKVDISACAGKMLHYKRALLTAASGNAGIAFYDSSSTFIANSGVQSEYGAAEVGIEDATVQVPVNAKYASFTCPTSLKSSFAIWYTVEDITYTSGLGKRMQDAETNIAALQLPRDIAVAVDTQITNFAAEVSVASHRYNVQYKILPGSVQTIKMKTGYKVAIRYRDVSGNILHDSGFYNAGEICARTPSVGGVVCDILFETADGTSLISGDYTTKQAAINANLDYCSVEYYKIVERTMSSEKDWALFKNADQKVRRAIRSIAHQGYYGASGGYGYNMAPYYMKAAEYGFNFGECDIKFSSDNVPVCCHDATFTDGISGNTITIAEHTFAELETYDYHGGKLSSFDDVVKTCKLAGMGLYVDHLSNANTEAKLQALFSVVKKYNMERRVVWTVTSGSSLSSSILAWDAQASIALIATTITAGLVSEANGLKTPNNDVRLYVDYSSTSVSDIVAAMDGLSPGISVEVWTIDSQNICREYLPFVTGIVSNRYSEPMSSKCGLYPQVEPIAAS